MTPEQRRKLESSPVELHDGRVTTLSRWLKSVTKKLPNNLRYKRGENKDKLVNHYEELLVIYKEKGRMGVLDYINGCYERVHTDLMQVFND